MSIVDTESFDGISNANQRWQGTSVATSTSAARTGSRGLQLTGGSISKSLAAQVTYIAGFAFRVSSFSFAGFATMFQFTDGGSDQVDMRIQGSAGGTQGQLEVTRNGTVLGTSSYLFPLNIFHYLEIKTTVDPVTGSVIVRVDGDIILTVTGANTRATANTQINGYALVGQNVFQFDDVVVIDGGSPGPTDFIGDVGVYPRFPSASGTYTQYTSSTANPNWQNVDEAQPDDDTSYNYDQTAGHKDSFKFQSLGLAASAVVYAVNVLVRAEKDDSGPRSIKVLVRFGGSDFQNATTLNLGTPYQTLQSTIYNQDPTSASWTVTNVDAAEWGYETQ